MGSSRPVVLVTNNGDIGGGEIMLLALAKELKALGVPVRVVGPARPAALIDAARDAGHSTVPIAARGRAGYMLALRQWRRRNPGGLLWCNGLVPSTGTAGMARRIVHLHQIPAGLLSMAARLARLRAVVTLVPSHFMHTRIPRSRVLDNWVEQVSAQRQRSGGEVIRLGFLGRPSLDKGVHTLAAALQRAELRNAGRYRLLLAGEPRFVGPTSRLAVEKSLMPVTHLVERVGWMAPLAFFGAVDMLICPSLAEESFGLVVAEAMSARVPVIVSDAGALREVAGPDHPWVVPAGDVEALAEAIETVSELILESSEGGALDEVLSAAHDRWRDCYSPEAGRKRLADVLAGIGYYPVAAG